MGGDSERSRQVSGGLVMMSVVACLVVTGCSDIHPAPNSEEGGMMESTTHEADALRNVERQEQEGNQR